VAPLQAAPQLDAHVPILMRAQAAPQPPPFQGVSSAADSRRTLTASRSPVAPQKSGSSLTSPTRLRSGEGRSPTDDLRVIGR
jgi:hypothetical protein